MRLLLLVALVHLLLAPAAMADIWQWTDPGGVVRYTPDPDRVPSASRGTLVKVAPGMTPTAARAPAEEPALLGLPDEVGADPFNAPQRARSVDVTEIPEPAWNVDAGPPAAATAGAAGAAGAAEATGVLEAAPGIPDAARAPEAAAQDREATTPMRAEASSATPAAVTTTAAAVSAPPPAIPSAPAAAPPATTASGSTPPPPEAPTSAEPTLVDPGASESTTVAHDAADTTLADAAAATTVAAASTPRIDPWSAVATTGAAAPPPSAPEPVSLTAEQVSRRDELEELIARDEEALKKLLSDTSLDTAGFEDNPELREIAMRLPALQAELKALKEGWTPKPIEAP